jgi:hypothetical protein
MFYPVVEIPLMIYIVINFIRVYEAFKSGIVKPFTFTVCFMMFPIELIFVLWFRSVQEAYTEHG